VNENKGKNMKKFIIISILFAMTSLIAEKIEIKTGDGYKEPLNTVKGIYRSKYQSHFPYVCYDKRIKVVSGRDIYLSYKGCTRIDSSCQSVGRAHFGKYPNDYKAYQALGRCVNARPKFID
jgi:hypothetical protein